MWSAAALAALFAGWRLWQLMSARVHLGMANAILVKLIKADNLDRAKKLCDAAPRSVYFIAVRAALGSPDDPRPTFEEAFARAMGPLQRWRWMDGTALVAGVVAVVIAATAPHVSAVALLFGIGAAGCALLDVVLMRRLRREPRAVFGSIVDALVQRRTKVAQAEPLPEPPESRASDLFDLPSAGAEAPRSPPPTATQLDLRGGRCPLCGGREIAQRAPVAGDLVPWVCEGCGYAQLFAAR